MSQYTLQTNSQVNFHLYSIISNPFEQKYRGIKTSNNTIKAKIMSLKDINELLITLGFIR